MTISNIKLIVGLGNPELKYINTRHNIGYRIIDKLLKEYQTLTEYKYNNSIYRGYLCVGKKQLVALLKPTTGMNNSGLSVKNTIDEMCLLPSQILVIYDDISLPFGTIRLRESGSAGGHKGIKSIIEQLQTEDFNRLKVGIGQPINSTILDWVLSNFTKFEQDQLSNVINFTSDIVTNILRGVITQGDTFNL
jgi:PTH1 family peptidyl-tRNA hydrolase